LAWSFMQRANFVRRDPDLILPLNQAPAIPFQQAVLVSNPATLIRPLPRTAFVRGRVESPWVPAPAVQEARALARQPLPAAFQVRAVDPFAARPRPDAARRSGPPPPPA